MTAKDVPKAPAAYRRIALGVIYDASRDLVFHAQIGLGAFVQGKAIAVSGNTDPTRAMALLGHSRRTALAPYLATIDKLYQRGIDYRRMGAGAIGLIRVADGTADLYFEGHLNSWDMLAAALIAHEAGAEVQMPTLEQCLIQGGPILAATPGLMSELGFLDEQMIADGVLMQWPD